MKNNPDHLPVMLDEVVRVLRPQAGESYFDGTAGYGGHAAAILGLTGQEERAVLVDRDKQAAQALQSRFEHRVRLMQSGFLEAAEQLHDEGVSVDLILLDLGVSSPQVDQAGRGFSFRQEAPLDMRMDQTQGLTADEIVNRWPLERLEVVIRELGEEPKWRAVARSIVQARPLATTTELAAVVRRAAVGTKDIDPATRTFQGLRIEVNSELEQLRQALPVLSSILAPGGRIAVISFHSLEDRIVKQFFDQESRDCICPPKQPICTCGHVASLIKITMKPVKAGENEIALNPRARSAKLRAAEKINKNKRR
jgi:16S rRNA (cytosine1402-N4)-methyltransferase